MTTFSVALLQLTAHGNDQGANLRKGLESVRRAAALGADLALFPEMWNIGYTGYGSGLSETDFDLLDASLGNERAQWQGQAIDSDDLFFTSFADLAKEANIAIALTFLEKWPGQPRNSVSIIDRHGSLLMTYAKVHTCDFSLEEACTPGEEFLVCQLDIGDDVVKLGAMICFDREFPESARILMLKGAEIIVVPNACELEANRIGQFRARAFENMVGMAMANYPAPQNNGRSTACDARMFNDHEEPLDPVIIEAGEEEGIFMATFDLDAIRAYRQREVWGNAFRKPAAYGSLNSALVEPPFKRKSAR